MQVPLWFRKISLRLYSKEQWYTVIWIWPETTLRLRWISGPFYWRSESARESPHIGGCRSRCFWLSFSTYALERSHLILCRLSERFLLHFATLRLKSSYITAPREAIYPGSRFILPPTHFTVQGSRNPNFFIARHGCNLFSPLRASAVINAFLCVPKILTQHIHMIGSCHLFKPPQQKNKPFVS